MSTYILDFVQSIDENWKEVDTLLDHATDVKETDTNLYNALCRSVTVLIVAHLEGFTKDLIKNIIKDINANCNFTDIPKALKRTYCKKYLGNNSDNKDKGYEKKISILIDKFDDMECSISHEPFLFPSNKNPNSHIIKTIFSNAGVNSVFSCLHESELESIFSSTNSELLEINTRLKDDINNIVSEYPYKIGAEKYGLNKKSCTAKTIWEEFLEQINHKRHLVAHGNDFNNSDDVHELQTRKIKVVILQQLLILIICHKVINSS